MTYITVPEAMRRLGKSDRQVRRLAKSGRLTWRHVPDTKGKRLELLAADVDRLSRHTLPAQELARLDRLEQEIIALRAQLDALSSRVDTFITPREIRPQKTILRSLTHDLEAGEALPDGWMLLDVLVKQRGLDQDARKRAIRYLDRKGLIHRGEWRNEGHPARLALDETGQAEFQRRYGAQK